MGRPFDLLLDPLDNETACEGALAARGGGAVAARGGGAMAARGGRAVTARGGGAAVAGLVV